MAKHKLLLADDSITIQKVVNLTFADEGIEVTAVGDGDAAMQKFVESVPDLVMVDVNMPGVDGYRICEMIKQDEETSHIPVILLVGSFEPFNEEEARRVGADDFLTKPFQSIRQLVNKVNDLLNGKRNEAFGGESAGINSFDETLKMDSPISTTTAAENFGDAAMDDLMIQTSQISSLPVSEAQKFNSAASDYPTLDDEDSGSEAIEFNETSTDISAEDDTFEAASLPEESVDENADDSADDSIDDSMDDDEILPRHENIYEYANEQESAGEEAEEEFGLHSVEAERGLTQEIETVENAPEFAPENVIEENVFENVNPAQIEEDELSMTLATAQGFELDDFDLLELPQSEKSGNEPVINADNNLSAAVQTPLGNLSPEEIEAIADKVVEKLSDQTIKRIVREVFTQMKKNN